jgi:hypothetical protein
MTIVRLGISLDFRIARKLAPFESRSMISSHVVDGYGPKTARPLILRAQQRVPLTGSVANELAGFGIQNRK